MIAFAVVTVISFTGYNMHKSQETVLFSDIALKNAEALADPEDQNCDDFNGYRRIKSGSERIYDCCYREVTGRGKTDCKRW